MNIINDENLVNIKGGSTSVSSTVINACVNLIETIYDIGRGVGSAIRRFVDGELCPLR